MQIIERSIDKKLQWSTSKKVKVPTTFKNAYPDSTFERITPENYLDWVSPT